MKQLKDYLFYQDQWQGCYNDGWQGDIVPEAFLHPAKFSRGLIHRIYKHAREMGWVKGGDWVIDPFGGVALGGLDAMAMGLNWIGIELEPKFCNLAQLNIWKWRWDLRGWPNLGTARIVQGDSRKLKEVMCNAGERSSTRPSDVKSGLRGTINQEDAGDCDLHPKSNSLPSPPGEPAQRDDKSDGPVSCIISSPPYADWHGDDKRFGILRHKEGCECNFCRKNKGNKGFNQGYQDVIEKADLVINSIDNRIQIDYNMFKGEKKDADQKTFERKSEKRDQRSLQQRNEHSENCQNNSDQIIKSDGISSGNQFNQECFGGQETIIRNGNIETNKVLVGEKNAKGDDRKKGKKPKRRTSLVMEGRKGSKTSPKNEKGIMRNMQGEIEPLYSSQKFQPFRRPAGEPSGSLPILPHESSYQSLLECDKEWESPAKVKCSDGLEQITLVIGSPPFTERIGTSSNFVPLATPGNPKYKNRIYHRKSKTSQMAEHGHTPGNLANLPEGKFEMVVSSPPFLTETEGKGLNVNKPKTFRGILKNGSLDMGQSPGQLGSMKEGSFDLCVSSPPYEGHIGGSEGCADKKNWFRARNTPGGRIGISSNFDYGKHPNQLGNSSGDTFWSASHEIVQECYELLKPGGHAIWVCKDYVKNKKRVPFSGRWLVLCESVGFKLVCRHQAMLVKEHGTQITTEGKNEIIQTERKSFFRRLAESKGSPRIDNEDVICLEKP